jgi:hypothetical protein
MKPKPLVWLIHDEHRRLGQGDPAYSEPRPPQCLAVESLSQLQSAQ